MSKQLLLSNLKELMSFMLTSDILSKSQQYTRGSSEARLLKKVEPPRASLITPEYSDKLFWCFYIMHKGKYDYDNIGQKVFSVETENKIRLVSVVRENVSLLKHNKLSAKSAEVDLANSPWISISTFHALCLIHELSCLIIKGRMCYRINCSDSVSDKVSGKESLPDIIVMNNGSFSIDSEKSIEKVKKYIETYWNIDSLDKPLRSMSHYKVDDIKEICKKLDISCFDNGKPKTKKDMYQEIIKKV